MKKEEKLKLLIIFNKDIKISPEKICIHVGHSIREISINIVSTREYVEWGCNFFKTVLLKDKITENIISKIKSFQYFYEIYDAGLDNIFEPGTILGYAVLVPESDTTFKRLRILKFGENNGF